MADDLVARLRAVGSDAQVKNKYGDVVARGPFPLCLEAAAEIERLRAAQPNDATRTEFNRDGTLNEIVAFGAFVHLEQMDSNQYWLMITAGETDHVIWLTARGKITASYEPEPACIPTPPEEGK